MLATLNRILNLQNHEWPRLLVSWSMTFLTRIGFIIGSTILLATFLSQIGVQLLPVFFLGNALLAMLGTVLYRPLLHRVRRELLITYTVLYSAAFLIASVAFLPQGNSIFFVFYMIGQAVFVTQLSILISLFNEELFSPLESQRVFPVIESAETLGGIIGGFLLSTFSHSFPAYKFMVLWVILLLLIVPIVLLFNPRTLEVPKLEQGRVHAPKKLLNRLRELKKIPFLKGLLIVVCLHLAVMNVVEFQYTNALQNAVAHSEHYEEDLTTRLGTLHMVFYSVALFIQLIAASRVLTSLGVVWSMLLHPIGVILNVLAMTYHYSFASAALVKGGFEFTNIFFKNGYDSTYYAIPHELRDDAKEVLQGLIKPLGALLGTGCVLGITLLFQDARMVLGLNVLILIFAATMGFFLRRMSGHYTEMCEHNLSHKLDLSTRLNAVEILGQKGHGPLASSLQRILKRPQEPLVLKEKIIHTLGLREDVTAVETLLTLLDSPSDRLRFAVIQALNGFEILKKPSFTHSFTRTRVLHTLEAHLLLEKDALVREALVDCLFTMNAERFTDFVLRGLNEDSAHRAKLIRMLKLFSDPNLKYYLAPALDDKDPEVRAAALVALWKDESMHSTLVHHLEQMLKSPKKDFVRAGVVAAGEVVYKPAQSLLHELTASSDKNLQKAALLSLAQLEDVEVIPSLIHRFLDPSHEWFEEMNSVLGSLSSRFAAEVNFAFHHYVSDTIHQILAPYQGKTLQDLSREHLETLSLLYSKISAHHEAHQVQKVLDSTD
ncbi:HEAT repeat domain-containing protein [Candidatus Peregrinibacteria bacterium]|nr:MAG: HEAT repeat domain-containing protein [Candidatus Peregrinibacteria bacterium]